MPRHSLKGRKLIRDLLENSRRVSSDRLTLHYQIGLQEAGDDYLVAFLIPGRAGKAVQRNRIKRWLREDFRDLQKQRKVNGGFIVRFKSMAENADHPELSGELAKLYSAIMPNE
nr:ribonuclease P protein component [candidate division Zixibacteria bacterium]